MALALHGRGELQQAFERFKLLPTSDELKANLYHLGKDFERKKDFALAKKVFKHLVYRDAEYKDARARYRHARAALAGPGWDFARRWRWPVALAKVLRPLPAPSVQRNAAAPKGLRCRCARLSSSIELGKGAMGVVYQGRVLALRPNGGDQNLGPAPGV